MMPSLIKHLKSQRFYLLVEIGQFTEKDTPLMAIYYPLYRSNHHDFRTPWVRLLKDHESAYERPRREGGPRFAEVKAKDLPAQEREVLNELLLKLQADLDLAKTFYLEPEVILSEYIPIHNTGYETPPIGLEAIDITPYQTYLEEEGYIVCKMGPSALYIWDKMKARSTWERRNILQADIQEVRRFINIKFNRPQVYQRKLHYTPAYHNNHIDKDCPPLPRRHNDPQELNNNKPPEYKSFGRCENLGKMPWE
jgi:hypothetical protein